MAKKNNLASKKVVAKKPDKKTRGQIWEEFQNIKSIELKNKIESLKENTQYISIYQQAQGYYGKDECNWTKCHKISRATIKNLKTYLEEIDKKIQKTKTEEVLKKPDLIYKVVPEWKEDKDLDSIFIDFIAEGFIRPINDSYFRTLNELMQIDDEQ